MATTTAQIREVIERQRCFDSGGAGTRMGIYPVHQSAVHAPRRPDLSMRSVNVRYGWSDVVHA